MGRHAMSWNAKPASNRVNRRIRRPIRACVRYWWPSHGLNVFRASSWTQSIIATWGLARGFQTRHSLRTCAPCIDRGTWPRDACRPAGRTSRTAWAAALSGFRPRCQQPYAHARGAITDTLVAACRRREPDPSFRARYSVRPLFSVSAWITQDAPGLRAVARLRVRCERTILIPVRYSVRTDAQLHAVAFFPTQQVCLYLLKRGI